MREDKETFRYVYAAPTAEQRREIDGIRRQYLPRSEAEEKFERLKRIDRRAKQLPRAAAIALAAAGVLVFGTGLALALEWNALAWGSAVCALGATLAALARPLHTVLSRRAKRKYGAEILELSAALLEEKNED